MLAVSCTVTTNRNRICSIADTLWSDFCNAVFAGFQLARLHLFSAYWTLQRGSSPVPGACSRHRLHADVTLADGRLSDALQVLSDDVRRPQLSQAISHRRHNHQNLDASRRGRLRSLRSAKTSEFDILSTGAKNSQKEIERERETERERSLWLVNENGTLYQPRSETPLKHLCSSMP